MFSSKPEIQPKENTDRVQGKRTKRKEEEITSYEPIIQTNNH